MGVDLGRGSAGEHRARRRTGGRGVRRILGRSISSSEVAIVVDSLTRLSSDLKKFVTSGFSNCSVSCFLSPEEDFWTEE